MNEEIMNEQRQNFITKIVILFSHLGFIFIIFTICNTFVYIINILSHALCTHCRAFHCTACCVHNAYGSIQCDRLKISSDAVLRVYQYSIYSVQYTIYIYFYFSSIFLYYSIKMWKIFILNDYYYMTKTLEATATTLLPMTSVHMHLGWDYD